MNKSGLILKISSLAIALIISSGYCPGQTYSQIFTATGSWVVPDGVSSITVECWGAGGGGGGMNLSSDGGGGGGGGAYSKLNAFTVIPGNTYSFTVGVGGPGGIGVNGTAGGDTYFVTNLTILAKGGSPGSRSTGTPPPGGAGGASSAGIGDIKFSGGDGGIGRNNSTGRGGPGGSSAGSAANGTSGPTTWSTVTAAAPPSGGGIGGNGGLESNNGNAPSSGYGGGGGGAGEGTNMTGGAGAGGQIIISWSQPVFYYVSGDPSVRTNWKTSDGYSPASFTANNQTFYVQSGTTLTTSSSFAISGTNTILEIAGTFNENNSVTFTGLTLRIDDGGILNHNVNSILIFGGSESFNPASWLNYGYAGSQAVVSANYGNLILSGSGTKTFAAAISVSGSFAVSTGVVANLGTFTSSAGTLSLGGFGQNSGSWGSTSSSATNKNNTFFSATTGIINVSTASCSAYMGYAYERNITIDYTKVAGGSDLYNFPVLVNLSGQDFLKPPPIGKIFNSSGYDIIFTDATYNKLDHQIEYFNTTNGDMIAWIRVPVLSSTSNTIIKIIYGNPAVTTDPSVTSVWDSHYKGIWHLDNSSLNDFTSFNKSGTAYNTPTFAAGKVNNSMGMNGTNEYAEVINDPAINFAGNITVSAWVYMNAGGRDQKISGNQNNSSGGYKFGIYTNNKVEFEIRNSSNTPSLNRDVTGGTVLSTGQWYYLAGVSSDVLDSIKTYVNGSAERPFKKTGILGIASNTMTIGKEPFLSDYYFSGNFDELRISDEVRSGGWLRTEYNNQSSPSTFYSLDLADLPLNTLPSASRCAGPITLTFGYPEGGTYSGNPYVSGNIFTPPSAGTYSIRYTYSGSCGAVSVTKDFIITDTPTAPAAANMEFCSNQITYLQATTGVNIRWYSGGTLVSTANPYSTGQTVPGTYNYTVTQTVNGCESAGKTVSLTIYGGITINTQPLPATICAGNNASFTVAASGYNLTYQWQEGGVNISNGGIYSGATTAILTLTNPGVVKNGKSYRCVVSSSCGTSPVNSNAVLLTVNPIPVATFSYTGTPYCPNAANPSPTFSGGGVAGTFSSTAGLVFVSTSTGQVNIAASNPGDYIVTNTIAASGGCSIVTATSPITIIYNQTWTGSVSTNWNTAGNWSCSVIPGLLTNVVIPNVANRPVISGGTAGKVNNLTVNAGSSLTINGNTIQISGTITNNGTLTATNGSIVFNGSTAQSVGSGTFAGNTIKDLTINNSAGVTLLGILNVTGIVTVQNGDLSSSGNLTLVSSSSGTALIDGSGTGTVIGNVTMQRYLASGFGYKYFSSPFQAATVGEFGDDMDLNAPFGAFYSFDENRMVSGVPASGWVNYTLATNVLNPLSGYAVNFGSSDVPNTADVSGVVNNGPLSVCLYNHNQIYTTGFNLVGNPYPSAIDWDLVKVNNTNVDDAVYFFKASTTDQYGGTYSSYVNGVSSGGATKIIPSMQGFFVHITPSFPVVATLAMNNAVRITNQTSPFARSMSAGSVPILRLSAAYQDDTSFFDPVVVYFDDLATADFDSHADALKIFNTDAGVPNLYAVSSDGLNLSVNALPQYPGTDFTVPLGLTTYRDGDIVFKVRNLSSDFPAMRLTFTDEATGKEMDLLPGNEYSVTLSADDYENRFFINISNITTDFAENTSGILNPILIYASDGLIKADINELQGKGGTIMITNLLGQNLFITKVYCTGHYEFNTSIKDGIYIVSYTTGEIRITKKVIFLDR